MPTWPGEPDVLDERTGTEADSVCSEQRWHVVIVLVIKLVNSADPGRGEMVIGVDVDDVTAEAGAVDTAAEVEFR